MKSSKVMPCTSCPGRCFRPVAAAATKTELFASLSHWNSMEFNGNQLEINGFPPFSRLLSLLSLLLPAHIDPKAPRRYSPRRGAGAPQ